MADKVLVNLATGMEDKERVRPVRGGRRQARLCPICLHACDLDEAEKVANAEVVGAMPVWEWADNDTTVFSY